MQWMLIFLPRHRWATTFSEIWHIFILLLHLLLLYTHLPLCKQINSNEKLFIYLRSAHTTTSLCCWWIELTFELLIRLICTQTENFESVRFFLSCFDVVRQKEYVVWEKNGVTIDIVNLASVSVRSKKNSFRCFSPAWSGTNLRSQHERCNSIKFQFNLFLLFTQCVYVERLACNHRHRRNTPTP